MRDIRIIFINFLLAEDLQHISIPKKLSQYDSQTELVNLLKYVANTGCDSESDQSTSFGDEYRYGIIQTCVVATVDWFDQEKNYGFVDVEDIHGKVFLHKNQLEEAGIDHVSDGDDILCDIGRDKKGLSIAKVHDIQTDLSEIKTFECEIIKLFPDRGYGFIRLNGGPSEAFFHYSVLPKSLLNSLSIGTVLKAEVRPDNKGRGLQVRRVIS